MPEQNEKDERSLRKGSRSSVFVVRSENAKYTGHNPPSGLGFINGEAITRDEKAAQIAADTGFAVREYELVAVKEPEKKPDPK